MKQQFGKDEMRKQCPGERLLESANFYRMKITRSANRVTGSLGLDANIMADVSVFTKLIATPAPDAVIRRQRTAIPRTDGNLSRVFHAFHFDNAVGKFCSAIPELPDGIEPAPTIHLAFSDRAGMVQVGGDKTHAGFEAGDRRRGKIAHRIPGPFSDNASKIVSPTFQTFGVYAAREVLRIRAGGRERANFAFQPNNILHNELRAFFLWLVFH